MTTTGSDATFSIPSPTPAGDATAHPRAVDLPRDRSCPYQPPDAYAQLRTEEPAARLRLLDGTEGWLLTRYEDVRAMLSDPRFSSKGRVLGATIRKVTPELAKRVADRPSLLNMDPPEHTRMRRLLTGQFSVRRMRLLAPRVHQIVNDHLDAMIAAGPPADLVASFALPIPSLVICELLGVPYADRTMFQQLSHTLLRITSDPSDTIRASDSLNEYMRGLVARKRVEPTDDLLSALVHPDDPADELTDEQLISLGTTLLIAGHETTANQIGLGTYLLLSQPGQWASLVDADVPLVESAVEELLRYLTIIQFGLNRRATEDMDFAGVRIRAGQLVVASLSSADADPARFADPESLDLNRGRTAHLAFGWGIHQCLGQQLARIELNTVFTELPRRLPSLRFAIPVEDIPMRTDMFIYGVHELPVTWDDPR
jgi:cytochrome P450